MDNKQIFFSHTWQKDNLGRDNHKRVYELAKKLENCGWSVWIDEDQMIGNIDAAMASGIDNADVILVCLTENYCLKVNETAKDPHKRDNCLKEWTYANTRNKLMVPIIMEPNLLSIANWPPGVVSLYFGSTLYINATSNNLNNSIILINKLLEQYNLQPKNKLIHYNSAELSSSNIVAILKNIEYNLALNKTKITTKTKSKLSSYKNLLNYIFLNKKFEDQRRLSEPNKNNKKFTILSKRWGSTGQLKKVAI
jgi:hypothetical protein